MPSKNPWIQHLSVFWKANKGKMSYRQAMTAAKKTYKKKGSSSAEAPKRRRRKKKKAL